MTQPLHTLSACEAAERLAQRSLRAEDLVRACLEHIDAREPEVQAWQHLARDAAIARAKQLDAGAHQGALHGLPIGVKDLLATADMPTGYGSAIYQHHTPAADAACVAVARQQGAVVMGKTVTTEFATFQPNQTRNPLNLAHTPGGSSSGSAAAVADHMVPLALGTQTAGSLIRPASYCGIVGYKPSMGLISRAGAKPLSDTLDVVGTLARNVPDAAMFAAALSGRQELRVKPVQEHLSHRLRVGVCRTYEWGQAEVESQNALLNATQVLKSANDVDICDITLPPGFQISVYAGDEAQPREIFRGTITAVEAEYATGSPPEMTVLAEDALQRLLQLQRARRGQDAALGSHEQRIVVVVPQLPQHHAHRGLAQADGIGGARHVLGGMQGQEDPQMAQVEVAGGRHRVTRETQREREHGAQESHRALHWR